MIVTIDGPAGAGKSTVARLLAKRLGFRFLDTGAMYRAVALGVLKRAVDPKRSEKVAAIVDEFEIELNENRVLLDGVDVTEAIRTPEVAQLSSVVAEIPQVRQRLVQLQRQIAENGDYVCEGRDQGTVVFPNAQCKIFLTASPVTRARRRWKQLRKTDPATDLDDVVAEQKIRDLRDETRAVGRLVKADDALTMDAEDLSADEIVNRLEQVVKSSVNAEGR